jgi:hypothetical protein
MSDKLTKAQKAAEPKKKKKLTVEEDSASTRSIASIKKEMAEKNPRSVLKGNAAFPLRYAVAAVCALVLLVFVSVLFSDEGVVLQWIVSGITGLFGRNYYYISMPALAYTIFVLLFSRNQKVRGRCFSIAAFVFLFGCASHLVAAPELTAEGFGRIGELWTTGILGTSGGLICGLLTDLLVLGLGRFFVGSMLLILCVLCLMIGAKLDLVGWTRALWAFCVSKFLDWRDSRQDAEDEDYAEPIEDEVPGIWNRLWDTIARKRAEKQEREVLEPAAPTPRERTRQMIQEIAPEL